MSWSATVGVDHHVIRHVTHLIASASKIWFVVDDLGDVGKFCSVQIL